MTASLLFSILILGALVAHSPVIGAQSDSQDYQWDGDLSLEVTPDGSIQVEMGASMTKQLEAWEADPIIYESTFQFASSPAGQDLTEFEGSGVLKFGPQLTDTLSSLELDIVAHGEGLDGYATILLSRPGFGGVEGRIEAATDESTMETALDIEMSVTVWHEVFPREQVQMLVDMFPILQPQLASQLSELTEGNLTLQELSLEDVEINPVSSTATLRVSVFGNFAKGMLALARNMYPYEIEGFPDIEEALRPEGMPVIEYRSYDMHLTFDEAEQAFTMDVETLVEGDVDGQLNAYKNLFLEGVRDASYDPEQTRMINDFFLPTDVSVVNLAVDFEYTNDGETSSTSLNLGGLELRPPEPQGLLEFLQDASSGGPEEGLTLTLVGGEDENGYVEIQVPEDTTDPLQEEPRRVVWAFSDLENLDQVSFVGMEWEEDGGASPFGTETILLVGGGAVLLAAAAWMLTRRK